MIIKKTKKTVTTFMIVGCLKLKLCCFVSRLYLQSRIRDKLEYQENGVHWVAELTVVMRVLENISCKGAELTLFPDFHFSITSSRYPKQSPHTSYGQCSSVPYRTATAMLLRYTRPDALHLTTHRK